MKRNRTLLSLFTTLCLVGCGAGTNGTDNLGGDSVSAGPSQTQILQGRLKVGGLPVNHTEVQLSLNGQVLATATSDNLGNFQFDLQPSLEELSRPVAARGVTLVDVTATIDGARYSSILEHGPEFVWVTEITTLVHDYLEDHPQATFEEADRAVGRSLGCPAGEGAEQLSDRDVFDPATFQQQAAAHGGDRAFFARLRTGLGTQSYNFAAPDPYEALKLDGQDPHQRVETVQARAGESELATTATLSALGNNLSLFGWIVHRLGMNTDPTLPQALAPVLSLQTSLNLLQADLQAQFPGTAWNLALERSGMISLVGVANLYTTDLAAAVAARPAPTDLPFTRDPTLVALLAKSKDLYSIPVGEAMARLALDLFAAPDKESILSYHKLQMASLGRTEPTPGLGFYDLRFNEVTDRLQNNLNYRLGIARSGMEMLANTAHSQFLQPQTMDNRLVADTLRARELLVRGQESDILRSFRRAQQLVPPKLDRDDIIVLPPDFPGPVPGTPTLLHRGAWSGSINFGFSREPFFSQLPHYIASSTGGIWRQDYNGQWRLADDNQMRALDRLAQTAGNGDAVEGMRKLGILLADSQGDFLLLYRGGEDGVLTSTRHGFAAVRKMWVLSRPGQPGGPREVLVHQRTGGLYLLPAFNYYEAKVNALFVRGSLSDRTPEQSQSLLATGCAVKPQLTIGFTPDSRAVATATYRFPNGQECSLEVTDRVAWSSDNPDAVEVSNLNGPPFPSGTLITTRPGQTNISAALMVDPSKANSPDGYVTATRTYENSLGAEVRRVAVTPRNVILNSDAPANFYCTSFAASTSTARPTHHVTDVTKEPALNWELYSENNRPISTSRAEVIGGVLHIYDSTLPNGNYLVRAELRGGEFVPPGSRFADQVMFRLQR